MATKQGMCKNCGSLVMFDDRDELCECVFCNCVFPSAEAAKILENPDGYEFKNEKFEKNTEAGAKHYYSNPVLPDVVEKAVQRDKTSKTQKAEVKLKPNEFEISPNDVKAPKKLVIGMAVYAFSVLMSLEHIENVLVLRYYAEVEAMPDNYNNTEIIVAPIATARMTTTRTTLETMERIRAARLASCASRRASSRSNLPPTAMDSSPSVYYWTNVSSCM